MDAQYRVRPASADDLAAVLDVLARNQADLPTLPEQPAPAISEQQIATWERIQRSPDVTVYLAETTSHSVGTACLSVLPNITYEAELKRPPPTKPSTDS